MQPARPYNPYQPPIEPITQAPPPATIEDPPLDGIDPVSMSSLKMGIAAAILSEFPVLSLIAIILGFKAISKAQEGRYRVEASNGALRGKGAHIAGRILGIVGVIEGIVCSLYWLWALLSH